MSEDKRYAADCSADGEWFVYDNEMMYCLAGPLGEEKAIDMAIELNANDRVYIAPDPNEPQSGVWVIPPRGVRE